MMPERLFITKQATWVKTSNLFDLLREPPFFFVKGPNSENQIFEKQFTQ